jgi:hypothetical protein
MCTPHQNSVAESSNRITERRVRLMMIAAPRLPRNLWPYATKYTAELMNHYPSTALPDGKTPRQLLLEFLKTLNPVPSVYGIRKFGQPGRAHIPELRRGSTICGILRLTKTLVRAA